MPLEQFTAPVLFVSVIALIATLTDLRVHRIPNWLTLGGALIALLLQGAQAGWSGLGSGIVGLIVGFLLLLLFYIKGGMAAGDVKLMAAVGAGLGWPLVMVAGGATLVWGMLLGLGVLIVRQGFGDWLRRYRRMAYVSLASRRMQYEPPDSDSAAARPFPYAIAILLGVISALVMQAEGLVR